MKKTGLILGVTALLVFTMGASVAFAATPTSQTGMDSMMNQSQMKEHMGSNATMMSGDMSANGAGCKCMTNHAMQTTEQQPASPDAPKNDSSGHSGHHEN